MPYQGFLQAALTSHWILGLPGSCTGWGPASCPSLPGAEGASLGCYTSHTETVLGPWTWVGVSVSLVRIGVRTSENGGSQATSLLPHLQDPAFCSLKVNMSKSPRRCCGRTCVPWTVSVGIPCCWDADACVCVCTCVRVCACAHAHECPGSRVCMVCVGLGPTPGLSVSSHEESGYRIYLLSPLLSPLPQHLWVFGI